LVAKCNVQGYPAVVPQVTGTAFITGLHQFFRDPLDSLWRGFLLLPDTEWKVTDHLSRPSMGTAHP
jgi:proline racemase